MTIHLPRPPVGRPRAAYGGPSRPSVILSITMRNLFLGIDLGTSYFKLGLFDPSLGLRGLGRVAVPNTGDRVTTSEVTADDFWKALATGLREALGQADASADEIAAVSWSSQANSFLLFDENRVPVTPLMLWNDNRATPIPRPVLDLVAHPDYARITCSGSEASVSNAVTRLAWLRDHCPDLWKKAAGVATIADYLALGLTGERKVDAGTAALLTILDCRELRWWDEGLSVLGLDAKWLPDVVRSGTPIGPVNAAGAALMEAPGLEGALLVAGTLDHAAAAIGAGLGTIAQVSESTGTVLAALCTTKTIPAPDPDIIVFPATREGYYDLLAFDSVGAGVLEWYHRVHASSVSFREIDDLAKKVPADCDGLRMTGNPQDGSGLRAFEGATPAMGVGHYARAVMEAITDKLGVLLDRLQVPRSEKVVATGGGARSAFWLQLKRDRLGIETEAADCSEPACRGAASLAIRATAGARSLRFVR